MKTLKYNKNSWHYMLAAAFGYSPPWDGTTEVGDICSYSKHIFVGIVVIALLILFFAILANALIHVIFGVVFSVVYGTWLMTPLGEVMLFVLSVLTLLLAVIVGIPFLFRKCVNRKKSTSWAVKSNDGFIKSAYKSWKEKTCVKIEFVE